MYIPRVHIDDVFLAVVAHNARGGLNCAASCSAPPNPQTGAAHSGLRSLTRRVFLQKDEKLRARPALTFGRSIREKRMRIFSVTCRSYDRPVLAPMGKRAKALSA